jgi:hypothetical protein
MPDTGASITGDDTEGELCGDLRESSLLARARAHDLPARPRPRSGTVRPHRLRISVSAECTWSQVSNGELPVFFFFF